PKNILHQSVRRNTELARVFHDLKLMEREGSGFDLLYDVLTSQAKPLPTVREGNAVLREPESTEDTGVPSPHGSAANRTTSPTRTGQSGLDSPR
ncbi:MAG: hypothetical protein KDA62_12080, partial [Planctomycetales bacterium]|nr:hypothetical protein [Planctomycetales bacterium]